MFELIKLQTHQEILSFFLKKKMKNKTNHWIDEHRMIKIKRIDSEKREKLKNIGYFFKKIQPKTTATGILLSTMMMMMINTRHPYITCIKFTYIRFI